MGIRKARKNLIPKITGKVLELGAGTGANLKLYNFNKVEELVVTDKDKSKHLELPVFKNVKYLNVDATKLPFEDDYFDYIAHTLVFCSIDDVDRGLQEIKRVLKPTGKIVFIEHVLPEKRGFKKLVEKVNPVWITFSQGCNLNKDYLSSLQRNGFEIEYLKKFNNTIFVSGIAFVKS
jgi:ubiquinone/menaquinone biosynthesis C-methylase UbiE